MNNNNLTVLVLMPASSTFDDIYQLGIKETCQNLHVDCQRLAKPAFGDNKLENIFEQIAAADLIIADMTTNDEKVFFQMGYALGIGKKPLLLAQNIVDISAEFEPYEHLIYNGEILQLQNQLKQRLEWCLRNIPGVQIPTAAGLEYWLSGQLLGNQPCIKVLMDDQGIFQLTLDYQNITAQTFTEKFRFCMVAPATFTPVDDLNSIDVAQGTARMILLGSATQLSSGQSHSMVIKLSTTEGKSPLPHPMELEVYSETGIQKYPFTIITE